jgi:citronellyl-CoA dehydrogenase
LGYDSVLRDLYLKPDPRYGFDPDGVRRMLADLDSRADLGTTLSVCVQASTAIPLLQMAQRGASSSLAEVTAQALDGTAQIAVAATDGAAAGSDLTGLGSTVTLHPDHVELTGVKRWIVNATTADWAIVLARHAPGRQFTSFSLLLVPLDLPGVHRSPADTTAFAGSGIGELTFDNVRLDPSCVLGGRGRGLALFARQLAGERLASGLWAEALAGRVLADTRAYLRTRLVEDVPLWQNAAVRVQYAAAVVEHQRLQALGDRLCLPDVGSLDTSLAHTAVLKAAGALALEHILATCGQLLGAEGFRAGGLQQLRTEAAMFGIAGGSTATMFEVIAEHSETLVPATGTAGT